MIYINIMDNLNVQFVNNQYVIILLDHNKIFNLTEWWFPPCRY